MSLVVRKDADWREREPNRICPACGEQYGPNRGEKRANWARRKTCGQSCATAMSTPRHRRTP